MNLYQDIFNLLESKTSKAFRAMDAQMELAHRKKHGRSRTKAERKRDRKKVGAIVKSNISSALAQNKERDAELKYGVGKGVSDARSGHDNGGGGGGVPVRNERARHHKSG